MNLEHLLFTWGVGVVAMRLGPGGGRLRKGIDVRSGRGWRSWAPYNKSGNLRGNTTKTKSHSPFL